MVYTGYAHDYSPTLPIISWLQENPGCSLVYTPISLPPYFKYLWNINDSSRPKKSVSIVICTLDRPESLNETLKSLTHQTFKDFEVILITERGDLSVCRDKGLRAAIGDIVTFIDDDVYCPSTWLQGVVKGFREGVLGVTGPTIITSEYQKNRDSIRYKRLSRIQGWLFGVSTNPGKLSVVGTPSMASNDGTCLYEGEVDYLECCNMSVKRKEALDVNGFDRNYIRTSEWAELDLSLKLSQKGKLIFSQDSRLYHRPSKAGVYKTRIQTRHRWENFKLFQKRWVRFSLRRNIYWGFVWIYFKLKERKIV